MNAFESIAPPAPHPTAPLTAAEPIDQVVHITGAGVDALTACYAPSDCDLCRRVFARGDAYYRVTLGMDDRPSHVGARIEHEPTVEDTTELTICAACEPVVSEPLERLLSIIWDMRKPDPELDEPGAAPEGSAT